MMSLLFVAIAHAGVPIVSTDPATQTDTAAGTTATINGTVDDDGENTDINFELGLDTSYGVNIQPNGGSGGVYTITAGTGAWGVSASLTGLTCNTTYHYLVHAINGSGTTDGSDQTFTTHCAPDAPYVTFVKPGDTTATVYFMPGSDGGNAVTGFTATSDPGGLTSSGCTASPCVVTGLTDGQSYTFTVTATNSLGTSSPSVTSDSATPNPAPQVVSVAVPPNANYIYGQNLDFTVTWDSNVTVGGTPQIAITFDTGGTVQASYVSSPTPTTMLFRYTLGANDADTDGISVGALTLNGGTIEDAATGIDADTTLNSVGSTAGVTVDSFVPVLPATNIIVDNQLDPQLIILSLETGSNRAINSATLGGPNDWLVTSNDGSIRFVPATITLSGSYQNIIRLTLPSVDGSNLATMITNQLAVGHLKVTPPPTMQDSIGNPFIGGTVTESNASHILDTLAPSISTLAVSAVTSDGGTFTLDTTKKLRGFWIAVPAGSDAPSESQVTAGVNYGSTSVIAADDLVGIDAGNGVGFSITGLPPAASYDIYFAAVDAAGNAAGSVLFVNLPLAADLSITNTDGVANATPGGHVTYTITASNAGPGNAVGATVADAFPSSLTCTWTCVGAGGGTCTASGSGNINNTVNLPASSSVTYTASCSVSTAATGMLSNTATVSAPAGVTDSSTGNDSATDTDGLNPLPTAKVSGTETVNGSSFTPGSTVRYTIVLSNGGSGVQNDNPGDEFVDTLGSQLVFGNVSTSSGVASFSGGAVHWNGSIPAGGSVTITVTATLANSASGTVSNQGTVNWDSDGNGTNDRSDPTDDPTVAGASDPTVFAVTAAPAAVLPAPMLDTIARILLLLGIVAFALRRRESRPSRHSARR